MHDELERLRVAHGPNRALMKQRQQWAALALTLQ